MSQPLLSLIGKTALVTGASSGLGEHFSTVLAAAGARVVACGRRRHNLERVVGNITASGGEAVGVTMDVTNRQSVVSAMDEAEAQFGALSILINNAGIAKSGLFTKTDEASWQATMDTNLDGVWRVAQEFCNRLIATESPGSVINIASILGLRVGLGDSAYAVSKAAVVQLTKALALEMARKNIRVNAICPGYFRTELNSSFLDSEDGKTYIKNTPAMRCGYLSELDAPLLMLASDAGSFINGAIIPVDGGHLISSL